MNKNEALEKLFAIPRMGDGTLEDTNNVRGLYQMVEKYFKPDFVVAEIGSFQGVSTILFSMYANKVYSIDCYDYIVPPTGRTQYLDQLFADAEKLFIERTKHIENIIKVKKTGVDAAKDFTDRMFDCVYIDAEHDHNSVKIDINTWKHKVKKGGILSGHDYALMLPYINEILVEENLDNELNVYSDSSWSVIIK